MLSTTVCASCRSRKQKCDRLLPQCSRCERLWLKCHYPTPLSISTSTSTIQFTAITPPSSSSSRSQDGSQYNGEDEDEEQILINEFMHLQSTGLSSYLPRLNQILVNHKHQFDTISYAYLTSCQDWLRIVHTDDFRLGRIIDPSSVISGQLLDRGIVTLIFAMCIITRPLRRPSRSGSGLEPDPLRHLMYVTAKQLFFCGDISSAATKTAKPTLALIQAGLLLSVYEYGQGLLDAAHATISVCSSMVLVSGLPLLDKGAISILRLESTSQFEDEAAQTWWGIVTHERMISAKAGIPVRPLSITNNQETKAILNNDKLQAEVQSMLPHIARNRHYAAFYLRVKATVWLDLVLEMVNCGGHNTSASGMTFRDLDSGLIDLLRILVQLGMGSCCEAIAIALNAFFHLHKWRLSLAQNTDSYNDESSLSAHAIQTVLRILTDISTDHIPGVIHRDVSTTSIDNGNDAQITAKEGMFIELFPYAVHMIYLILMEVHTYRSSSQRQGQVGDAFAVEMRVMRQILEKQTRRWGIACDYIAILNEMGS